MKLKSTKYLYSSLPLLLVATVTILLQIWSGNSFGDPDGWYHLGMAQLYRSGWHGTAFSWLPHTVLAQAFFDQQYGYHLLLGLSPTLLWAKTVTVVFSLLLFCSLWLVLRTLQVRRPAWWALGTFILSSGFLARIGLVKGGVIGVVLYLLTVHCLLTKKAWPLFFIGLVWFFLHGSFVLLLPLVLSSALLEQTEGKTIGKAFGLAAVGLLAGYVLHPQHAALWTFFASQLAVPFSGRLHAAVGAEWYPFSLAELWTNTWPLLTVWAVCLVSLIKETQFSLRKRLPLSTWLILQSVAWFALFASSKRFIEYFAPLAALPAALTAQSFSTFDWVQARTLLSRTWQLKVALVVCTVCLVALPIFQLRSAAKVLASEPGADGYKAVSEWLLEHSKPGDIVFNTRWDSFPQLFYWNKKNYYVAGLDQLFLYNRNAELYHKYSLITEEQLSRWNNQSVEETIAMDFKAKFVIIDIGYSPKLFWYFTEGQRRNDDLVLYKGDRVIVIDPTQN